MKNTAYIFFIIVLINKVSLIQPLTKAETLEVIENSSLMLFFP